MSSEDTGAEQRLEWLQARQQGIGGSDAPAIAGLSPWSTPTDVYRSKVEPVDDTPPTDAMRWGTLLEPVLRQQYVEVSGNSVVVPQSMFRHRSHPWMLANLDGLTTEPDGDCGVLEIKTARSDDDWGEPGTDEVPDYYLPQVQHYLAVTCLPWADVALLVGGSDFRIYRVYADHEFQEDLIAIEAAFWRRVIERDPPDPLTSDEAAVRWPKSRLDEMAEADQSLESQWLDLLGVRQEIDRLESRRERLELSLKKAIGERSGVRFGDQVLATWKSSKPRKSFDAKALQAAMPDIYEQFVREVDGSRRFLLKQPKKAKSPSKSRAKAKVSA